MVFIKKQNFGITSKLVKICLKDGRKNLVEEGGRMSTVGRQIV